MKILLALLFVSSITGATLYFSETRSKQADSNSDILQLANFAFEEKRYEDALRWYTQAALLGKANAQLKLSKMYEQGLGVTINDTVATHWARKAANLGLPEAQYIYAIRLEFGRGIEAPDSQQAQVWYEKSAQGGYPKAMVKLANILILQKSKANNIYQALNWASKAEKSPSVKADALKLRKEIVSIILRRARSGDSTAQFNIAMIYQNGEGKEKSMQKAWFWLEKSSYNGNLKAQYTLGKNLANEPKKWRESLRWLTSAAKQGHADAGYAIAALLTIHSSTSQQQQEAWRWLYHGMRNANPKVLYNLAIILHKGQLGLNQTDKYFTAWLTQAANRGIPQAQNDIAVYYTLKHQQSKKSLSRLERSATLGDAKAQFNLGLLYARGDTFSPNNEKALFWWQHAKKNGSMKARMMLGLFYHIGRGAGKNEKLAIHWYEQAIKSNSHDALFNLAMIYYHGQGVAQDYKKAAYNLHRLAKQGDAQAQNIYALLLLEGKGVGFAPKTAVNWLTKAAKAGNINAMFNLAIEYRSGTNVPQNDKKAIFWYKKAAEKNFPSAQNAIGYMYAEGRGVKRSVDKAEEWFYKASDNGLAIAKGNISTLQHGGTFSLSTFQVDAAIRSDALTNKNLDLSQWLEVHHQPIL